MKTTLLILALLCLLLQGCQSTQAPPLENSTTEPQAKASTDKTTAEELQFLKTAQFWPAGRTEDILGRALREGLIYNGMTLEAATELLGPYASIDKDTGERRGVRSIFLTSAFLPIAKAYRSRRFPIFRVGTH